MKSIRSLENDNRNEISFSMKCMDKILRLNKEYESYCMTVNCIWKKIMEKQVYYSKSYNKYNRQYSNMLVQLKMISFNILFLAKNLINFNVFTRFTDIIN